MPQRPHPSYDLLAGTPEQAATLAAMVAGLCLVVTGAGGTGKTTVLRRYMAWLGRESRDTLVHHFSLQTPEDAGCVRGYSTERISEAAQDCVEATGRGLRVIAVIDEYTLIEPDDYADLTLYDQVIATGDPAQDRCAGARSPRAFVDFMKARGALTRNFDRVWRTSHLPANNLLDYYAYGGRGTAVPASTGELPDILRANCIPDDPHVAALAIFARLLRNRIMNANMRTTIAIRDEATLDTLRGLVALLPDEIGTIDHRIVDPTYLQGLETDILLVHCRDFDEIYRTPDSIVRAATTTLGRARARTDLLFTDVDEATAQGRMSFTLLMKLMLSWAPEPRTTHPGFRQLEDDLAAQNIDLIPIDQGVMFYSRARNAGFKISMAAAPGDAGAAMSLVMDLAHLNQMSWREADAVPDAIVHLIPTRTPLITTHSTAVRERPPAV